VLPTDVVVATQFKANAAHRTAAAQAVGADEMILDAGPQSTTGIETIFEASRTLVWNGPLGAFELPPFDAATNRAARTAARLTRAGRLLTVAGGGDTVAALAHAGVADAFSYISTAGGAFLEWLEGKTLPGIKLLQT
jgi:phosphoglycerate kinase